MNINTEQGALRLSRSCTDKLLITVDDDVNEQQAKAVLSLESACWLRTCLNYMIKQIKETKQ